MHRGPTGQYKVTSAGGERVRAFIPGPLPPDPPLELTHERQRLVERATLALGRLDSVTLLLPDPDVFLYAYVRREAVVSSQIEGTQSSLAQLLLFELEDAPGVPLDDVVEVSNYVAALNHGLDRLQRGSPLEPPHSGDARSSPGTGPGERDIPRPVPAHPELDRWPSTGKRPLRPAAP